MAFTRRFGLPLLAATLAAGPLAAQVPTVTPKTFKEIQSRESQRLTAAHDHLLALRAGLGLDSLHTFKLRTGHSDELGQTHGRFQQHYLGVRVWGGEVVTHTDVSGAALPATVDIHRSIHINVQPNLAPSEAIAVAHQDLAPKGDYVHAPAAELVIYPETIQVIKPRASRLPGHADADLEVDGTMAERQALRYTLAYCVRLDLENGAEETKHMVYMVNAQTGAIITQWNDLHTSAAVGTGKSQWYGTVSLNTNSVTSGYELRDMTRGTGGTFGNNVTTNLNHATSGNGTIYTDADNAWGDGNGYGSGTTTSTTGATGQTAAVDQHHGMASTWDFYKNVLGRNGIDNTGKAAYGRMHYSSNYDNAFWDDSCFCMTYGDGAPPSGSYGEADLDTVGHEMSHGVCATTANLTYSGESGGLNEANSDIFGTCVEFYVLGANGAGSVVPDSAGTGTITANYTMFENSWGHAGQALRYMYKPSLDGASPDAWSSSVAGLDVHYSSGPMNRCWYFMARGATTTGDTSTTYLPSGMTGVGNDHACRIWYRALTTYLTSSSNYAAARTAAINAAKDLYGAGSAEEQAVWNAFHGINVGAAWSSTSAPTITTQPASQTVAAGATATFSVVASGTGLSYQWYKNSAAVSGATAASYTTPATTSSDNGAVFYVKVTNTGGSVTSNNATLTVSSTAAPTISTQPASKTVAVGATATFSVTASGTGTLTYQWYKNGTAISGATAASYTTPATVATDNGATFYVKVTNANGTTTSSTATLTVTTSTTYTEVESNGSTSAANVIATNVTAIVGAISSSTDQDFYKITVPAGRTLTVKMTGPSGKDYDLYLLSSTGSTLKSSLGTTATETVTYTNSTSSTATYYIKVIGYSGAYSTTSYNLAITR